MARKFKRITDPNIATKSLATCNEKYRRNILSCMQQAMYYPHLRLSAVEAYENNRKLVDVPGIVPAAL